MKRVKYLLILCVACAILLPSCYKDKGNYDYNPLGNITISGLPQRIVAVIHSTTLNLTPTVTSNYSDSELDFTWVMATRLLGTGARRDTIGREKTLNYLMELSPDIYDLYCIVAHKKYDFATVSNPVEVEVGTPFSRGLYICKETAGGDTELDLWLDDGTLMENLSSTVINGGPISGKPKLFNPLFVIRYIDPDTHNLTNGHLMGIITENNQVQRIRISDLRLIDTHETMFYDDPPENDIPCYFYTGFSTAGYFGSTGWYQTGMGNYPANGHKYSRTTDVSEGTIHATVSFRNSWSPIFWDHHIGGVMRLNGSMIVEATTSDNAPIQGMTSVNCLHCDSYVNPYENNNIYFILEEKDGSGQRYLYNYYYTNNASTHTVDIDTLAVSLKFNSATIYAANRMTNKIIYFVQGNSLYYYFPEQRTETAITLQGIPAGETITFVNNHAWTLNDPNFNYLFIGTVNGDNYTIYAYEMLGGVPSGAPIKRVSGKGKVSGIMYTYAGYTGSNVADFTQK